jgi:hypothetical protein
VLMERVDLAEMQARLDEFPQLKDLLGPRWLGQDLRRPEEQWSLLTGWLSTGDQWLWPIFERWLQDLDSAIGHLWEYLPRDVYNKIAGKLRRHNDRAESKGTLSEVALALWLSQQRLAFDMERKLVPGRGKDVDFTIAIEGELVHVDVQWVSESDKSSRAAAAAGAFGMFASIDFGYKERRVVEKLFDKLGKFTETDITLVAFNYTDDPTLGTSLVTVPSQIFATSTSPAKESAGDAGPDEPIRRLCDGVLSFYLEPGNGLLLHGQELVINELSSHAAALGLRRFVALWKSEHAA